jgi:hypothetical protein
MNGDGWEKTLGLIGVDGRILKWILNKYDLKAWIRVNWLRGIPTGGLL